MARFLRRLSTNTTRKTIRLRLSKQPAKRIRLLKEGFWEETAIYERPDGQHIVRKASKPTDQPGPWALETLRREILYLVNLPPSATELFPPLLDAWGHKEGNESNDIGYEIPYFQDHVSVSERIASSPPSQQEAAAFQDALGIALFDRLHVPTPAQESISEHVDSTISDAIEKLSRPQKALDRRLLERPRRLALRPPSRRSYPGEHTLLLQRQSVVERPRPHRSRLRSRDLPWPRTLRPREIRVLCNRRTHRHPLRAMRSK
jgi:hypothetical protein